MSVILATAGYDHKIRFWEAPSGICSRTIRYPDSQVNCLEITPDKQFLAAGGNPHVRLFEINGADGGGGAPVMTCEGHASSVTRVGFQRDGRWMYSSSEDGTVRVWDLRSPTCSRSFDSGAPVASVALCPDQTRLVSGDRNGIVRVWDLQAGREVPQKHASTNGGDVDVDVDVDDGPCVNAVAPDARSAPATDASSSSSSPGVPGTLSPTSSSAAAVAAAHKPAAVQAVDVSENGRLLVAATNRADVFVWEPRNGARDLRPLARFRAHAHGTYLLRARIAPDGRHLVTAGSDRTARLWEAPTGHHHQHQHHHHSNGSSSSSSWTEVRTLRRHQRWVWDAVFSADSSYLVTASSDHWARLWNLGTGEVVRQYAGHQGAVTCVALNDSST